MRTGIDESILAEIQKFCHWFQRLTGLTNLWLARWPLLVIVTESVLKVANYHYQFLDLPTKTDHYFCHVMLGGVCVGFLSLVHFLDEEGALREKVLPFVLSAFRGQRILRARKFMSVLCGAGLFILFHMQVYWLLFYVSMLALTFFLYLMAVDPLPPCQGKIRQWLKARFARRPVPALAPSRTRASSFLVILAGGVDLGDEVVDGGDVFFGIFFTLLLFNSKECTQVCEVLVGE